MQSQADAWEAQFAQEYNIQIKYYGDQGSLRTRYAMAILSDAQELAYMGRTEQSVGLMNKAKYFMAKGLRMEAEKLAPACPSCGHKLTNLMHHGDDTMCCDCHAVLTDKELIRKATDIIYSH